MQNIAPVTLAFCGQDRACTCCQAYGHGTSKEGWGWSTLKRMVVQDRGKSLH